MNNLRIFSSGIGLLFVSVFLAGCSLPGIGGGANSGSVWKSPDNGITFEVKNKVGEKNRLTTAEVLSFIQDPQIPDTFYIGTRENGIFRTTDGGEDWEQLVFPPQKVYGLTMDERDHNRLYATGTYNGVGKVYRTDNQGEDWNVVYTEPGNNTVITALGQASLNPEILYVGTSAGVIIKSSDGGSSWTNLKRADAAVTQIMIQKNDPNVVTMLLLGKGLLRTRDGGATWETFNVVAGGFAQPVDAPAPSNSGFGTAAQQAEQPRDALAIVPDPTDDSVFYLGTSSGLFKSTDAGKTWNSMNVIASSKRFPIHAIAINPRNRDEIVYISGNTFYKTINGGTDWSTVDLVLAMPVGMILYDKNDSKNIYLTLRKF